MKPWMVAIFQLFAQVALGGTLTVRQDGAGDYTLIQPALDAAATGDTILVWPGRYYENLLPGATDSLTLASLELPTGDIHYREITIIDGHQSGSCFFLQSQGLSFTLRGLTFTNGSGVVCGTEPNTSTVGGGIEVNPDNYVEIINCLIENNRADCGGGIYNCKGQLYLEGTTIRNNRARWYGGGIVYYRSGTSVTYSEENRCNIYNNLGANGSDLYSYYTTAFHVIVDTFTVAEPSRFYANCDATRDNPPFTFDIQHGYREEINHDLYVAPWGNDDNSGLSEAEPLRNISLAVHLIASDSLHPRTVYLAAGTYAAADGQMFAIPGKAYVTIQGAGRDNTILELDEDDIGFEIGSTMDYYSVKDIAIYNGVDSFIISGASHCLLRNAFIYNSYGLFNPSLYVDYASDNVFENCIVKDCMAQYELSGPNFIAQENLTLDNFLIEGMTSNTAGELGNALYMRINGDCKMNNVRIVNNEGHSVGNYNFDMFTIAPYDHEAELTLYMTNCLFAGNTKEAGGAQGQLHLGHQGTAYVSNCTFANNTGGMACLNITGNAVFTNNIFWNPAYTYEIYLPYIEGYSSNVTFRNNDIQHGQNGILNQSGGTVLWQEGNLSLNPWFSGEPGVEYTLAYNSPLIDIGRIDTTGLHLPACDLGGNERFWDGDGNGAARIDMGCYEYRPLPAPTDFLAESVQRNVLFAWAPPQSGERSLSGYRVYRDSALALQIDDPAATDAMEENVPPGEHVYWVTAAYGNLDSPASNADMVVVDSTLYAPPTNLTAEVDGRDVTLMWLAPTSSRSRDLTGYLIYRDSSAVTMLESPAELTWTDSPAPYGASRYWVTALYGAVESASTDTASVHVEPPEYAPPAGLTASVTGNEVTLSWSAPATRLSSRTRALSGYAVWRDSVALAWLTDPNQQEYTDGGAPYDTLRYWVTALYGANQSEPGNTVTVVVEQEGIHPNDHTPVWSLSAGPNPFNPDTRVCFSLPHPAFARVEVYNIRGQLVKTLAIGNMEAGEHEVTWHGRDDGGRPVAGGVYLLRLSAGGREQTRKMILLK